MDNILDRADEIIKAFSMCGDSENCNGCPYNNLPAYKCYATLSEDMLAIVRALQYKLTKVTAERDAAVKDMTAMAKNDRHDGWSCLFCKNCTDFCLGGCNWEWRGVQGSGIIADSGD